MAYYGRMSPAISRLDNLSVSEILPFSRRTSGGVEESLPPARHRRGDVLCSEGDSCDSRWDCESVSEASYVLNWIEREEMHCSWLVMPTAYPCNGFKGSAPSSGRFDIPVPDQSGMNLFE